MPADLQRIDNQLVIRQTCQTQVITYAILDKETILLAEIYLKSDHDTVDTHLLSRCLKDQGLM